MRATDILGYTASSIVGYHARSLLLLLAMAIGVASVILLTTLGEGARRYVTGEFSALGTHLLIVLPGRSETVGGTPPLFGETPRDLTLDDALSLKRIRQIRQVAPIAVGSAQVSWKSRERESMVLGSTANFLAVRQLHMAQGRFLPTMDLHRSAPVCVLGARLRKELFGSQSALGQWLRIGDRRFRVIGTLGTEGRSIGVDLQDVVVIPVASAQTLFNSPSLFRIRAEARTAAYIPTAKTAISRAIRDRHEGEDDVTVITQDAVIATFNRIFTALTLTVGGIAAISLAVAGILIMNVMLVAVSQRTSEIGLLKALGATERGILLLFLTEAGLLSLAGAAIGLGLGTGAAWVVGKIYPALPMTPPSWVVFAAVGTALSVGLIFGVLPARRAAALDPVASLAGR